MAACSRRKWSPGGWNGRSSGPGTSAGSSGFGRCDCIPVALYLLEEEPKLLQTLSKLTSLDLELRDDPMMRLDEFRLMSRPAGRDVTELYAVA